MDVLAPVRAGDVFAYAPGRVATVTSVLPGGRAQLRIEGTHVGGKRDGQPCLQLSEQQVRVVKGWPRVGRAEYRDGCYFSAAALAKFGEG